MRSRWTILPAVALLGGCLAAPHSALGQGAADASCTGLTGGDNVTPGTVRMAQTFTAGVTGRATGATITLSRNVGDQSGDYLVKIGTVDGSGVPTGTILGGGAIPDAAVPAGSSSDPFTAVFGTDSPDVSAGQSYALIVSRPAAPGGTGLRLGLYGGFTPCPGSMFKSDNPGAPFVDQMADLLFTVFVQPPSAPPAPAAPAAAATVAAKTKCKKGKKRNKRGKCVRKKKRKR